MIKGYRTSKLDTSAFKNVTVDNFDAYEWNMVNESYLCKTVIDPCLNSDDSFAIESDKSATMPHEKDLLRLKASGKYYKKYCLLFNDDTSYSARICHPKSEALSMNR